MVSLEKRMILTPLQKLTKNGEDWGKLIVAKGLKSCPKSKISPNLVTLSASLPLLQRSEFESYWGKIAWKELKEAADGQFLFKRIRFLHSKYFKFLLIWELFSLKMQNIRILFASMKLI